MYPNIQSTYSKIVYSALEVKWTTYKMLDYVTFYNYLLM